MKPTRLFAEIEEMKQEIVIGGNLRALSRWARL